MRFSLKTDGLFLCVSTERAGHSRVGDAGAATYLLGNGADPMAFTDFDESLRNGAD